MPRSSVTEIAAAKQQLRAEMRQKRQAMFPMEKKLLESRACKRFLESAEYRRCGQLFCFVSLPQEPDTLPILQQALKDGKTVAVPRCLPERRMAFHLLSPERPMEEQLKSGTYGVPEPSPAMPEVIPGPGLFPLCLVPGLAFDHKGGRLGYGAGYYDRFLAHYRGAAVLLCRERLLRQEIPFGVHDYTIPWVLTEAGLFEDGTPSRLE